ncbi:hypothetical protein [Hymenobacter sp. YC55]|uniref:hypothetical protein n=1 Tax=Hymenobacter sp. YC55 TaxID=3034019 RepID=UPI0023F91162|nr:hypothetical protein [Hymenobacter sp. YC55]MDF7814853.1 hypothetical protein [Hymenobacter sp. YC55]
MPAHLGYSTPRLSCPFSGMLAAHLCSFCFGSTISTRIRAGGLPWLRYLGISMPLASLHWFQPLHVLFMYCLGSFSSLLFFPSTRVKRAHAFWSSLTMSPTNYRGWRVVFSPVHFFLDTAALQRESHRLALLIQNQVTDISHNASWPSSAIHQLSSVYSKVGASGHINGSLAAIAAWQRSSN